MELLEWIERNDRKNSIKITERKYFNVFFVGGICLLTLILGIIYALMSKTVYFWDNSTYWDICRMLTQKPLDGKFFAEVYNSIGTSDYNYLAAVLPSLWMRVFGVTRVSYIAAIISIYLIPTQITVFLFAKRITKAPEFAFVMSLISIPAAIYLTVIGFIDIGGVLIGMLCYYLYFKDDNKRMRESILLGVLLTVIMVFRRYFAFFSVSFLTAMIIDNLLVRKDIKNTVVTLIACGLTLVVLFYPFFANILLKDYGTLYSSYKYDIFTDFKLITRYFGVSFIALTVAAVPLAIIKKRDFRGAFALFQIIVCAVMFMSTQTHGQQHLLLYVPAMTVLLMLFINSINTHIMLVVLSIVSALTFISPFIPRTQPQNIREIKHLSLLPTYSVKPRQQDNVGEILSLKRKLDKKIPEGKKCGILASSFTVNSSILDNVIPSLNMKETREDRYIVGLPEVDSRDFWRLSEIYNCDYILTATPAQTHLAEGEQTIVIEAIKSFSEHTDIATAFSEASDFKASVGNIELKLYKRTKDVTKTAMTEFEMRLFNK